MIYYPSTSPDRCWDAVKSCPSDAAHELQKLCEEGIANYINNTSDGQVYRNQFCMLCHNISLANTSQPIQHNRMAEGLGWLEDKLVESSTGQDTYAHSVLALIQPKLQPIDENETHINADHSKVEGRLRTLASGIKIYCAQFINQSYNFCINMTAAATEPTNQTNNSIELHIWEIGSLACSSNYHKVCDVFLVADSDEAEKCSTFGCKLGKVLDPSLLQCQPPNGFHGGEKVFEKLDHTWSSKIVCSYRSQCRSAFLGFLNLEDLNCYCDQSCIYYNDCCEDSPFQPTEDSKLEYETYACYQDSSDIQAGVLEDNNFWGIMQIDRCPSSFQEKRIKAKCEHDNLGIMQSKPWNGNLPGRNFGIVHTPVTDSMTGLR